MLRISARPLLRELLIFRSCREAHNGQRGRRRRVVARLNPGAESCRLFPRCERLVSTHFLAPISAVKWSWGFDQDGRTYCGCDDKQALPAHENGRPPEHGTNVRDWQPMPRHSLDKRGFGAKSPAQVTAAGLFANCVGAIACMGLLLCASPRRPL
jgi:hypothetical protein